MDAILKTISETLAKSEKINLVGLTLFLLLNVLPKPVSILQLKKVLEGKKVVKFKTGSELANAIQ